MKERIVDLEADHPWVGQACQACAAPLAAGARGLACPRCKGLHHLDCWIQRGGCSTLGCREVASDQLLPQKHEEPIRVARTPGWVVGSVVLAFVALALGIYLNAQHNARERAMTTLAMISASDQLLWERVSVRYNERDEIAKKLVVSVTPDMHDGALFPEKLVIMLAAKDGPEIATLTQERLRFYGENDALLPLDDLHARLSATGLTIESERLEGGRVNGVLYGIPHPTRDDYLVVPAAARYPEDGVEALAFVVPALYEEAEKG